MSSKVSALSSVSAAALAHEFLVNDSGTSKKVSGTQLKVLFGGAGDPDSHLYVKADFGAAGDGTTDDTAEINNAIAAVASNRGQELIFEPGVYLVPNGITETKSGLVVRGIGARTAGPGQWGDSGVVIKATAAGAFCWTHDALGGANDYQGGRFENLTFKGDADTGGGLRIRRNFVVVQNCGSCLSTTGIGFLTQIGQSGGDDSSWVIFDNCLSQDDLIGFQANTAADAGTAAASAEFRGCIANKTSGGGIVNTGVGIRIYDNNSSVFGGKMEANNIGIEVLCTTGDGGTTIIGTRFEANNTYDISLNRPSGTSGTRNLVVARAPKVYVGAFQVNDAIMWAAGSGGALTDLGTDTVIFGEATVKATHVAGSTPTGGYPGEIRIGSGKIWANDAGTWKSSPLT